MRLEVYKLYSVHFQALSAYAGKLLGSNGSGEDIAQETFLRAMRHMDTLSALTEGQQKTWLYTTARRLVIDQQRRKALEPPPEEEPIFQDDLTRLEVVQLLDHLPPDCAQILRMRHFAGMNSTEIARVLQMNPGTVRTKLRSAIQRLQQIIHETEE